jgi:Domain of unknown function (DUF222)
LLSNLYSNTISLWKSGIQPLLRVHDAPDWMWSSTDSTTTSLNSWRRLRAADLIDSMRRRRSASGSGLRRFGTGCPLIDHKLIADAEATDLAAQRCFSSLAMLLTRTLQLSPAEAAGRVRAAVAVGTRNTTDGEQLGAVLTNLAAAQREGAVSPEQVRIVERAMQKLTRPDLNPEQVSAAEQQLVAHAQLHGPKDLQKIAARVVDAVDPDSPGPVDEQLQQDRRHLELRQRRDGMWQLEGKLTNTVGAQLHAILDPVTRPRSSSIEVDGKTVELPDQRHYGQRLHDGFEDACGRLLQLGGSASCWWHPSIGDCHRAGGGSARQGRDR